MKKLGLIIAAAAMVAFAGGANAGSLSSSKAAFALGDLVGLGAEACSQAGASPPGCVGGGGGGAGIDDTGWHTVMQTFIKTPNGKDLSFDVALQCALVTFTEAKKTGNGSKGSAAAEGRISVRVMSTPVDSQGEPTGDPVEFALPDNDGANVLGTDGSDSVPTDPDGVTYCYRFQELAVAYNNFECTGTNDCELAVSLLLKTLNAHAFNFILPNVISGNKMIEVQARAVADSSVFNAESSATGEAFVGMGATLIETLRLVNSFDPDDGPIFTWIELQ